MKTLCFLLASLATVLLASGQQECHTSHLDTCIAPMLLNARKELVPRNAKELEKRCEQKNKMWNCVDNYMEKCVADVHHMMMNLVLDDSRMVMDEWCESGSDFQRDYLKIASCLSDATKNANRQCLRNVENVIYQITGDDIEARIPSGCCCFNKFYNCFYEQVEKSCGRESFPIVNKLTRMMGMHCARNFCSSYDPSSDVCSDVLARNATASEKNSYLSRFMITMMKQSN
ncbi:uncharacterized protein [Centruroides vittatus]|uniref:uncharacterized protein n=1 Tax=Centruroides vittatus TaxID=120091 RepID=UPI00350F470A